MTAGVVLVALAAAWLGIGGWRFSRPGEGRTRTLHRLQGIVLLVGGVALATAAVSLIRD